MRSRSFRPFGFPIYVACVPAAPFASRAFSFAVVIRSGVEPLHPRPSNPLSASLLANWNSVMEGRAAREGRQTGQRQLL
jgi:hypothetical protein